MVEPLERIPSMFQMNPPPRQVSSLKLENRPVTWDGASSVQSLARINPSVEKSGRTAVIAFAQSLIVAFPSSVGLDVPPSHRAGLSLGRPPKGTLQVDP